MKALIPKKIPIILIILTITQLLALVSCNKTTPTSFKRQDSNTLFVALNGSPTSLDPQATSATITAQVSNSIYDTILSLVETWSVSEDHLRWTFKLKPNVQFHHGITLTANDVIATIERIKDPDIQSPFIKNVKHIDSIEENGTLTFTIVLNTIDSSMPTMLKSSFMSVLPADLIAINHNFDQNPVGTGPFKFESWEPDIKIALNTYDKYYNKEKTPTIEGVTFFIMPDVQTQVQALLRGDVDIVPYIIEPELSSLQKNSNINIISFPGSTVLVLAMNTRKPPMHTLEFRKAIAQAIDKQQVIDGAYPGSRKSNMFWYSSSEIYAEIPDEYNVEASKEYFANTPASDVSLVITVPSIFEPHVRAAQIYQSMLKDVGINTEIQKVDWGTWLESVYGQGQFDMTVIGHTGRLTPGEVLERYAENGGYVGWKNEEFASLIQQAKIETNPENRIALYRKALTIMTKEYPFVIVGENTVNFAIVKDIQGLQFDNILETYDFTSISITP